MKTIPQLRTTSLLLLVLFCITTVTWAAVPQQISYQGKLENAKGEPADGTFQIQTGLFENETGGKALWSEKQTMEVTAGIFSLQLGITEPIDRAVFDYPALFLEIQIEESVGVWETLAPRLPVASVAFARKTENSEMIKGQTLSDLDDRYINEAQTIPMLLRADLSIQSDLEVRNSSTVGGDYTATFVSSGGSSAFLLDGVASSTTGEARGLNLDVESTAGNGTGADIDVVSENRAKGIAISAFSSDSYSYGLDLTSRVGEDSTSSARGISSGVVQQGSGQAYGIYNNIRHHGTTGETYGIYLNSSGSDTGDVYGVYSYAHKYSSDTDGQAYGGYFVGDTDFDMVHDDSYGVYARAEGDGSQNNYGVYGEATNTDAVYNYGLYSEAATADRGAYGLKGRVDVTGGGSGYGTYHSLTAAGTGHLSGEVLSIQHDGTSGSSSGVDVEIFPSDDGWAWGFKTVVHGENTTRPVYGIHSSVIEDDETHVAYAGWFEGRVFVHGNLSKSGGSFTIDHPLDPENKYLQHSFVESPDMKNIYDGIAILDENGEAWVELPDYFEALNADFRYQLTCIGGFAPVYIAEEIADNRFQIAGGSPQLKVSWQVTGTRIDAWAQANRIEVEIPKP